MKILLTGSKGRLGKELCRVFPDSLQTTRDGFDFTDHIFVNELIKDYKPDVIIHAGAKTGIPQCEEDKWGAYFTNFMGTELIVSAVKRYCPECYIIYLSTPCVFNEEGIIAEGNAPNPQNYYGLTKLLGEVSVRQLENWCVLRTNFVPYEPYPHKRAFSDRFSNYLFSHNVANAIKEVVDKKPHGIIHIVGKKKLSMWELSQLCPESEDVKPMTTEEYYKEHPNYPKLTKNMLLISSRWSAYDITKP